MDDYLGRMPVFMIGKSTLNHALTSHSSFWGLPQLSCLVRLQIKELGQAPAYLRTGR